METARKPLVSLAEVGILLLIIAGIALNIYAPVWLKPPLFEYTIWLYLILFFAWVPVYLLYARRQRRPRFLIVFTLFGMCLSSFVCMVFVPRSAFAVTYLDTIRCEQLDDVDGRQRIACARVSFEGEGDRTLLFESLDGLSFMWLLQDSR